MVVDLVIAIPLFRTKEGPLVKENRRSKSLNGMMID